MISTSLKSFHRTDYKAESLQSHGWTCLVIASPEIVQASPGSDLEKNGRYLKRCKRPRPEAQSSRHVAPIHLPLRIHGVPIAIVACCRIVFETHPTSCPLERFSILQMSLFGSFEPRRYSQARHHRRAPQWLLRTEMLHRSPKLPARSHRAP